jgi:hypothetical protein
LTYQEDLEKRVEELEREVQFLSKVGEEAFLFRRIEKIVNAKILQLEEEKDELNVSRKYGDMSLDGRVQKIRETSIKLSAYKHVRRDIEHTREDMKKYDLKQLLAEDFFRF